jgi:hypothetical protein
MRKMGEKYEIVVFTASLAKVLDVNCVLCLIAHTYYVVCGSCIRHVRCS